MGDDGVIPNIPRELQSRVLESPNSITIFALVCKDMNYNWQMGFDSCNKERKALKMERKVTKSGPNEATSKERIALTLTKIVLSVVNNWLAAWSVKMKTKSFHTCGSRYL